MPKRMVSQNRNSRNNRNNKQSSIKDFSKRKQFNNKGVRPTKGIDYRNKIRSVKFDKSYLNKNIILTGITVLTTGIFGVIALNNVVQREEEVKAIEQSFLLPERQMPGVSKEGQKYADDATEVMKKIQGYQYKNEGKKVVYLTFDDGPSSNTSSILDVLEKNDIRATFFVTGQSIEHTGQFGKELLQRSYKYGNAIANHSYSHDYNLLYPEKTLNLKGFLEDFAKTDNLLKEALGEDFTTRVIRCPGGHMSWKGMEELQKYLDENNMASIDWNALTGDAVGKNKTSDDLYNEAVKTSEGKEMVVLLMHDASSKGETVKSLQKIIDFYKSNGYEFRTLA